MAATATAAHADWAMFGTWAYAAMVFVAVCRRAAPRG